MTDDIVTKQGMDAGPNGDIVTRLREVVAVPNGVDIWTLTALEAADEIERLRGKLAEQVEITNELGAALADTTCECVGKCKCGHLAALILWQEGSEARRG
jgi:hypothetical protein